MASSCIIKNVTQNRKIPGRCIITNVTELKRGIFMRVLNMDIYLANLTKRYKKENKHEKGLILNELCEMGGFHKKHAIRRLNALQKKQKPRIKSLK